MLSPKNRNCLKLEIAFSTKNAAHRTLAHLNLHFSGGVPPLSQHTPPATFIRRSPRQRRKIVREKSAPSPFPGEADTTQQNAHGRAADEAHKRMFFSPIRRAQTCRKLSTLKPRATSDPNSTAPSPRASQRKRSPFAVGRASRTLKLYGLATSVFWTKKTGIGGFLPKLRTRMGIAH